MKGRWTGLTADRRKSGRKEIKIRLDELEYEHLIMAVRRSGLSREQYLRQLIRCLVPRDAPPPDFYPMMQQLYDIQDSINVLIAVGRKQGVEVDRITEMYNRLCVVTSEILEAVMRPQKVAQWQ